MRLKSDFRDGNLDVWFHGHWRLDQPVFERYSTTTRTRKEDHSFLEDIGFKVPPRGLAKEFAATVPNADLCVYTDETAHRAEGKQRWLAWNAGRYVPERYATLWIGPPGISFRLLAVGRKLFWLQYRSEDHAFSNKGNVTIDICDQAVWWGHTAELDIKIIQQRLKQPLVAVDFVVDLKDQSGYAIDLNTGPSISGTGVENILSGQEIHDLIEARWKEVHRV